LCPTLDSTFFKDLVDASLLISVPIFVLGITLASAVKNLDKESRFATEYLHDACKVKEFTYLAFLTVIMGFLYYLAKDADCKYIYIIFSSITVGGTLWCLWSLVYIIVETTKCMSPEYSTKAASTYAARKLTYGYLCDSYVTVFYNQQKNYLKKWCTGKVIYSPEQCYGYYQSNLYSEKRDNDIEIKINKHVYGQNLYKDYNFKDLEKLNNYLKENKAELYLSSPLDEKEQAMLGILCCTGIKQNKKLQLKVQKKGRKAIRWGKYKFSEHDDDFWDSQESKLNDAIKKAVNNGDSIQVKTYLDAVNVPLTVFRDVRGKHKIIRDVCGEYVHRGYQLLRLYLSALHKIVEVEDGDQLDKLSHKVRSSIWYETGDILRSMDYQSMELYTWLVQQIYALIQDTEGKGKKLQNMRAQFGGFYEFAGDWLNDRKAKSDIDNLNKMQVVLHNGLTTWLLMVIEKGDLKLAEQLCDAGRRITFGRDAIKFDNKEVITQHLILAGYLINLIKAKTISTEAIEKLFIEPYSRDSDIDFEELVKFYLSISFEKTNQYTRRLYPLERTFTNLFTGSSHSSGFGSMGNNEISRTFIFLGAHALKKNLALPKPNANIAGRILKDDIKVVKESFTEPYFNHGIKQFEAWFQSCEEMQSAEEAKEIANARIDEVKRTEHEKTFWEGYLKSVPVLSMCLTNGNYETNNEVKNKWIYYVPKIALFNWKYPISGADGDEYGASIGCKMENYVLEEITKNCRNKSKIKGRLPDAISEAVKWLDNIGCATDNNTINNKGFIITISKQLPETTMYQDKDFIPSWREDVKSIGFNGFYHGYPIKRFQKIEEEDGIVEKDEAKDKKPQCEMVIAIDLRGWVGFRAREEVIAGQKYGELKIREWRPDEIDRAIESGELKTGEVDKAKGNCPVDVIFFWEYIKDSFPKMKAFKLSDEMP